MFYRLVRRAVRFGLGLFYRVRLRAPGAEVSGPVIYIGNHPNGLIDPALMFVISRRPVTFLAKAPLFKVPLLGAILKGLQALPVYRKQDDPRRMAQNEGTFEAATETLVAGRALMLFPEGKSHSQPALAELKTGAARIALRAAKLGVSVKIVPVGLTYEEKQRFRSEVLFEVGPELDVTARASQSEDAERQTVLALTDRMTSALAEVTLNLERWEDLPLVRTAEELYALKTGQTVGDPERTRRFARGVNILRSEQPARFERVRDELMSFGSQLRLVKANPRDLTLVYQPLGVSQFVLRNLMALILGLPMFGLGVILFGVPFLAARAVGSAPKLEWEDRATFRMIGMWVFTLVWIVALAAVVWRLVAPLWGIATLALSPPLAMFTRYFFERRRTAVRDARIFLVLGNRARLKQRLLTEGERLATTVEQIAEELRPRVA